MTQEAVEKAYTSEIVKQLRILLCDFYDGERFGLWLALPHPRCHGLSVLEMIAAGQGDEVIRFATQLHDGVYS